MNKNIKKIIALALAFGTISAVAPAGTLLTTKAYAADAENDDKELSSLKLETGSGTSIKLYDDDDYDNKVDSDNVSEGNTYYAKTTSGKIKLDLSGVNDKYIKVFTSTSDSAKGKDPDDEISISDDKTITIKIYDEKVSGKTVKYDEDDDDYNEIGDYTIKVDYKGNGNSDDDDNDDNDYDDIYLEKLSVDGTSIQLDDSKVVYNYNVANNVDKVTIKAVPDDEDYDVTIDGTDVDDGDSYKKTVSLKLGVNEFKIELDDDDNDDERDYTLKINRAEPVKEAVVVKKTDQWVPVNGRWQYNDTMGNPMKNTWFFDRGLQKWYFLGADGYMQTGWILNGGKYYYLNGDGSMASNTTISGYKLGQDGAWIQ